MLEPMSDMADNMIKYIDEIYQKDSLMSVKNVFQGECYKVVLIDPRGQPRVIIIFTHVVRPYTFQNLPNEVSREYNDRYCGLGRVDHLRPLKILLYLN